uniref:Uncharacterized protein n=1 Tax=viral metagenome TaxID=1070528 RepID=A0A6M3IQI3_9ZZZZ
MERAMKIYQKLVVWIVTVVMAVNMAACGGAYETGVTVNNGLVIAPGMVEVLRTPTVVRGMLGCVQGLQGTSIMENAKQSLLLLSWTYSDGNVGFVILNHAKQAALQNFGSTAVPGLPISGSADGNIASFSTWRDLTNYLETQGWTYKTPPGADVTWPMLVAAIGSWIGFVATTMPTLIFMVNWTDIDVYAPVLEDYFPPVELG